MRVCLVEAGAHDDSILVKVPLGAALLVPTRNRNWAFQTVPQAGLGGRRGYQPRGKIDRRLELDQRDDLRARPRHRLRRLGGAGRRGLVVEGRAAVFPARGAQRARRQRPACDRRPAQRGRREHAQSLRATVHQGSEARGLRRKRRLQRRRPGRRGSSTRSRRRTASAGAPRAPTCIPPCSARTSRCSSRQPRCEFCSKAGAPRASDQARGRSGGCVPRAKYFSRPARSIAPAADVLGHRPGGAPAGARHRRGQRFARGRHELAGSRRLHQQSPG